MALFFIVGMHTFTHFLCSKNYSDSMLSMLICADTWPNNGHVSAQAARADWTLPGGQRGPHLTHWTLHPKPLHSDLYR